MQFKLPDLNNAIALHRQAVMQAFDMQDWIKLVIEIRAYNAILPDDYALIFSSKQYQSKIKSERKWRCISCNEYIPIDSITIYTQLNTELKRKITHENQIYLWNCPSCHSVNDRKDTTESRVIASDPKYTGIIPNPPGKYNTADPNQLQKNFQDWYEIAITELEHAVAKLRHEYVIEEGSEFDINEDEEIEK